MISNQFRYHFNDHLFPLPVVLSFGTNEYYYLLIRHTLINAIQDLQGVAFSAECIHIFYQMTHLNLNNIFFVYKNVLLCVKIKIFANKKLEKSNEINVVMILLT